MIYLRISDLLAEIKNLLDITLHMFDTMHMFGVGPLHLYIISWKQLTRIFSFFFFFFGTNKDILFVPKENMNCRSYSSILSSKEPKKIKKQCSQISILFSSRCSLNFLRFKRLDHPFHITIMCLYY